jgi:hypothetical protein
MECIQSSACKSAISSSTEVKDLSFPFLASFMAAMVYLFGISGAKGNAFSLATLVIKIRKASEGVSPIAANTAVASSLILPSILARTTALAAMI